MSKTPEMDEAMNAVASVVAWLRGQEWVGDKPNRGQAADALERVCAELTAAKEKIAEQEALFRAITYIANPENWIDEEKMRHPVQNSPVPGAVVTISAQKYAQKIVAEFQL